MSAYGFEAESNRQRLFLGKHTKEPLYSVKAGVGFSVSPSAKSVYEPVIQEFLSSITQTTFLFYEVKPNALLYKAFVHEDTYTAPSISSLSKSLNSGSGSTTSNFTGNSVHTSNGVLTTTQLNALFSDHFADIELFSGNRPSNTFTVPAASSASSFTLSVPDISVDFLPDDEFLADTINWVLGYIDEQFTFLNKIGTGIQNGFRKELDMFESLQTATLDTLSSWFGNFSDLMALFMDKLSEMMKTLAQQIVAAINELLGSTEFATTLAEGIFNATAANADRFMTFIAQLSSSGSFSVKTEAN